VAALLRVPHKDTPEEEHSMSQSLSRRQFLKAGGATAAGVVVSPLIHAKEAAPAIDPGATVLTLPPQGAEIGQQADLRWISPSPMSPHPASW
jgi:hypothetical protein